MNQLLYLCHENLLSFDANPPSEVLVIFVHISKAFDKVCHKGLMRKMNCKVTYCVYFPIIGRSLANNFIKWKSLRVGSCRR